MAFAWSRDSSWLSLGGAGELVKEKGCTESLDPPCDKRRNITINELLRTDKKQKLKSAGEAEGEMAFVRPTQVIWVGGERSSMGSIYRDRNNEGSLNNVELAPVSITIMPGTRWSPSTPESQRE
jgi:hypothetical protein